MPNKMADEVRLVQVISMDIAGKNIVMG